MCESTADSDWEPFYFMNLNRFPWIQNDDPMYGRLENCPECSETRVRIVEPRDIKVVRDGETDVSADQSSGEEVVEEPEVVSGADLESPSDLS